MATRSAVASSTRGGARAAAVPTGYPASSVGFDWTMGVLTALLSAGMIQDGWAHAHGEVDQSFLTPWHAVLYGSMALNGFVLGGVAIRNRVRGYPVARALPFGYWFGLGGVLLFAAAGAFDLFWHTVFGIENGINGLLSPSHLLLALGAALVYSGVLRSIARQYGREAGGWRRIGPAVLALGAALILFGFFTAYAQPIEDGFTATTVGRDPSGPIAAALYEIDPRAGDARRLSVPAGLDIWGVAVAPDGKHIAYRAQAPHSGSSTATEPSDLYVASPDGSHARRVTHSGRHDTQLAWSPDGTSLAYISIPAGTSGDYALRVVRDDGSGARTLVSGTTTLSAPAWSRNGDGIAYASRRGLDAMIALVPAAGGTPRWLENTKGGSAPAWGAGGNLLFSTDDGALHSAPLAGGPATTIVKKGASEASLSPDGRQLVYLGNAAGAVQAMVADADGTHARNVSQLAGADAEHPAWAPDGRILYTVTARPAPERSETGYSLAEAANLLQAVLLAGVLLLVVRRWRAPLGTFTLLLPLFALAMAAQTDAYYDAIPALVTGLAADVALAFGGERLRSGNGFYAFAFCLPALFFALYLVATVQNAGGSAWTADMLLGSPLLAGCAGLLVGFCYQPPLPDSAAG